MNDETNLPSPSPNGGSPGADGFDDLTSLALLTLPPRTGREAAWTFPPDALLPQPNFGSWPVSTAWVDPDHRSRIRDVIVAALIALACAVAAGLYVVGVLAGPHESEPTPSQLQDPFTVEGTSGGKR